MAQELVQEDFPLSQNGEPDWTTLGNILTANVLGEVLCGSYVDFKYGRMSSDFRVDTEWRFAYEENDVLVFKKKFDHSPLMCMWLSLNVEHYVYCQIEEYNCFMGRGVIDLPLSKIATEICCVESTHIWDKFLVDSRCVKVLSSSENHEDHIRYSYHESTRCLVRTKRDLVAYVHSAYTDDKFVQSGISIECPECPQVPGIARIKVCLGSGWVLEPYEGSGSRTLVSYIAHIDLGGSLPPIIINRVLRRQPLTIHYLRQHLMKTHASETLPTPSNTMEDSHRCSSHNSARPYEETTPVDEFIRHRHKPSLGRPHSEHREEDQGSYHALASSDSV